MPLECRIAPPDLRAAFKYSQSLALVGCCARVPRAARKTTSTADKRAAEKLDEFPPPHSDRLVATIESSPGDTLDAERSRRLQRLATNLGNLVGLQHRQVRRTSAPLSRFCRYSRRLERKQGP